MIEKIYINLNAGSIGSARIESASDPTPKAFSPIVVGDERTFDLYLTDGSGNLETSSDVQSLNLSIGKVGNLLTATTSFLPVSGGFRMTINLANQATKDALAGGDQEVLFEVTRQTYSGESRTIIQAPLTLTGEVGETTDQVNQIFQECFIVSLTDEVSAPNQVAGITTFRLPFSFELLEVRASANVAPEGSSIIIDINSNGSSVLGQLLEIEAGSKTSQEATNLATITTANLPDDAEITIDIDQIGSSSPGSGIKVYLSGKRG